MGKSVLASPVDGTVACIPFCNASGAPAPESHGMQSMKPWMKRALALVVTSLVAGVAGIACGEASDGDETTETEPDGGTTETSPDGGTTETTPDGGTTETTPPPRRMLGGAATNTMPLTTTGATFSYPDGASVTQWAQLADPADGTLYVSVTRAASTTNGGGTVTMRQYLAFALPRDARGTVSCTGASATGHVVAGTVGGVIGDSAAASTACSFDVLENTATKVKIELKADVVVQGGITVGAGVLEVPLQPFVTPREREQASDFSIQVRFGDGSSSNGTTNPRVFIHEGKIAATANGPVPGGAQGNIDVRVPELALGPVDCNQGAPGSVGVSFMVQSNFYAFGSSGATTPCKLLVVRNDAGALTISNLGTIPMPGALNTPGAIEIRSLSVDAQLRVK